MDAWMTPQRLPNAGPAREALREKGQFWTPQWVAEAMVSYAVAGGSCHIFDPAVGGGAFFRAAKTIAGQLGRRLTLLGSEIDAAALSEARRSGLSEEDLASVELVDFVRCPPRGPFQAIVANPPYIRHHRIPGEVKSELQLYGKRLIGMTLDGRAGLHVYFLLHALQMLDKGGRLAFIMPADTCEGAFAETLWAWITRNYKLDAVVTFAPEASPFPGVDTNAIVFMIRHDKPSYHFWWGQCREADQDHLKQWALSDFTQEPGITLDVRQREVSESVHTGLSRPPRTTPTSRYCLGDFAAVRRGIATGANEFFFLTQEQATAVRLPDDYFVTAIGRTRDVNKDEVFAQDVVALNAAGRPTRLLALDDRAPEDFPPEVQAYLRLGEERGLPQRPLIAQRRPWYRMESRTVPPFLFAYLGRRNARFIRNRAGILPLTSFLCIYPHRNDEEALEKLWAILRHPDTTANLSWVGKSYGSGAIKVEPRSLERLPLPEELVAATGLEPTHQARQLPLRFHEQRAAYRDGNGTKPV
ncbi:MAG: SAM-dependent DNA methyltransferase [Armatimonadetes bacterium]|nr:SAM-dependent DNA methyltransferase [Armatimonadota bacterium]